MSFVATAVVGSAVVGGYVSSRNAKKGAEAQGKAAEQSAQVQWDMFNQQREDYAPYRETGNQALYALADLYGIQRPTSYAWSPENQEPLPDKAWPMTLGVQMQAIRDSKKPQEVSPDVVGWSDPAKARQAALAGFHASPGYQFRQDEAQKAVQRSAAARGMLGSGAALKALTRYSQGIASDEFNSYANRLAALAGVGQSSTNSLAQLGANTAANVGNTYQQAGAARASGYQGQANAINNTLNQAVGLYGLYQGGYFGGGN